VDHSTVDCLLQVGTNLLATSLVEQLELGKPVVAVNTATYWYALRQLNIHQPGAGSGQLMQLAK